VIVLDASAAVLGLLNDGDARARMGLDALISPHLVDAEVAQALRGQARRGAIEPEVAATALDRWARLGVDRTPIVGFLPRIWALRDDLNAYDATYVALAEALDAALLTADARLAGAPGVRCPVTVVRS
jgi:predicted nucleic acid-binding protein